MPRRRMSAHEVALLIVAAIQMLDGPTKKEICEYAEITPSQFGNGWAHVRRSFDEFGKPYCVGDGPGARYFLPHPAEAEFSMDYELRRLKQEAVKASNMMKHAMAARDFHFPEHREVFDRVVRTQNKSLLALHAAIAVLNESLTDEPDEPWDEAA